MFFRPSLRWRLALVMSGLIAGVLTIFLWITYSQMKTTLIASGGERALAAADQVANLFSTSARQRTEELDRAAADPSLRAFLVEPTTATTQAARSRLARLATGQQRIDMWSDRGEHLLEIAPADTSAAAMPALPVGTAPSTIGFSELLASGGVPFSEVVAAVPSAPRGDSGSPARGAYLVARRSLSNASSAGNIGRLVGGHAAVNVGNPLGGVWTDLRTLVSRPGVALLVGATAEYRGADGNNRIGAAARIAGTPWVAWVEFPEDVVLAPVHAFIGRMIALALFVTAIAAMLAQVLARRMTKPLCALTTAAEGIASGDYSRRAAVQRTDEIGRLGTAFDAMAGCVARDVAARHAAEEALRTRELGFRALFAGNPLPMWVYDAASLAFLEVNEAAVRHYGYSREEFLGMRIADIRPAEDVDKLLATVAALQYDMYAGNWRHRVKSGRIIDVDITSHPLRFAERAAVLVVAADVTERTRAESALRASEERFRLIAETVTEAFWIADLDSQTMTYVSPAYGRIWGRSCESFQQNPSAFLDGVHGDDRDRVVANLHARRAAEPFDHEYRIIRPDGDVRWIRDRGFPVTAANDGVIRYVGIAEDITERLDAERTRRESEERMRFALWASGAGIWESDLRTGAIRWSETLEALHGLPSGSFGGTRDAFVACIHPEDRLAVRKAIDDATRQKTDSHTVYRTVWPDGSAHWISGTGRTFYDDQGVAVRAAGVGLDVTDHRALEEQYRQAQKMEAIGRLAGGVAHDFNNILTGILGFSTFLLEDLSPDDPARRDVEEIRQAGESAALLTRQLLAFSRQQMLQPQILDLNAVVGRMDALLRRLIGEDIDLVSRLAGDLSRVSADPGQIEQIIVNLVVNARDAMRTGGRLTIETANVELDASYVASHRGAVAGSFVMLAVRDMGTGMDDATQLHIFEPFFTTKKRGEGTGLGLSTVYGIVKQSDGYISVESELGRGTTFKIYLPRAGRTVDRLVVRPPTASLRGTETILVAEDQPEVRRVARAALTRYGYTVIEAGSGEEVLQIVRTSATPIHLLLTDVIMPSMSGPNLVSEVRNTHPHIHALFASGYTDDAILRHGVLEADVAFIQKPFTPQSLVRKVREVLDAH